MFSNGRVVAYDKMSEVARIADEVVLTYSHANIFSETKTKMNSMSSSAQYSNTAAVVVVCSWYSTAAVRPRPLSPTVGTAHSRSRQTRSPMPSLGVHPAHALLFCLFTRRDELTKVRSSHTIPAVNAHSMDVHTHVVADPQNPRIKS